MPQFHFSSNARINMLIYTSYPMSPSPPPKHPAHLQHNRGNRITTTPISSPHLTSPGSPRAISLFPTLPIPLANIPHPLTNPGGLPSKTPLTPVFDRPPKGSKHRFRSRPSPPPASKTRRTLKFTGLPTPCFLKNAQNAPVPHPQKSRVRCFQSPRPARF